MTYAAVESPEVPLWERPIAEVAAVLQTVLTPEHVAYAAHINPIKRVGDFACGTTIPRPAIEGKLRNMARVVDCILKGENHNIQRIREAIESEHPNLENRTPLEVIRDLRVAQKLPHDTEPSRGVVISLKRAYVSAHAKRTRKAILV